MRINEVEVVVVLLVVVVMNEVKVMGELVVVVVMSEVMGTVGGGVMK